MDTRLVYLLVKARPDAQDEEFHQLLSDLFGHMVVEPRDERGMLPKPAPV
jgi:hypothetical protein